jgi:fermentation-respiration switch protein FrsA (DUF1100 family)
VRLLFVADTWLLGPDRQGLLTKKLSATWNQPVYQSIGIRGGKGMRIKVMKQTMILVLVLIVLILILMNAWMYIQQPRMIFFPFDGISSTPASRGLKYEEVRLRTSDGLHLQGWYIPAQGADKVLLFFHGNAGNISHRGDSMALFHRLGLNVFIFDYRGYGQSEGAPSEEGLYQDGLAAWKYLTEVRGFAGNDVILFGRSLGGAVATRLAARMQPGGLILESTFSSARDMADEVLPVISRLVYLRYGFNTVARIRKVHSPVLVLHSPNDEIIPYGQGRKVFSAANDPRSFFEMRGDHNSGFLESQPEYQQTLQSFVSGL